MCCCCYFPFAGKLTLGEINGPSDGMFLCMQFALLGYFVPGIYTRTYAEVLPSLFAGTAVADLTLNSFPLFVGWVGIVFTVIGKSVRTLTAAAAAAMGAQWDCGPLPMHELTLFVSRYFSLFQLLHGDAQGVSAAPSDHQAAAVRADGRAGLGVGAVGAVAFRRAPPRLLLRFRFPLLPDDLQPGTEATTAVGG